MGQECGVAEVLHAGVAHDGDDGGIRSEALGDAGVALKRGPGAEHYLDEALLGEPLEGRVVPYGDTPYLLVELPYQGAPPDLFARLFAIRKKGYRLVLAHLERFAYVADDDEALQKVIDAGYLVQVNLGSLAGAYSWAHKRAAKRLVKKGVVTLASGDCHRAEDVSRYIDKGRKVLTRMVGDSGAQTLLIDNPRRVLDGAPPEKMAFA